MNFMCQRSLNRPNYFNYINMTSSDPSGILRFLTDELQDSEDAGERGLLISSRCQATSLISCLVWIIGHVQSGWDGSQGLGQEPFDILE
jgi:sphingomyelin phosphodiesterase